MIIHQESKYYNISKDIMLSDQPDFELARVNLEKAAKEGDHRAIYAMATWHLFGQGGISVDQKKAVDLLRSISHGFVAEALFDLAYAYDVGGGVRKNEKMAFQYYMKAAILGDVESCRQLSQFYLEGRIVSYNKFLSDMWKDRSDKGEEVISALYRVRV